MQTRRIQRVNSLLREVIAEVIQRELKNPNLPSFVSISRVEVSRDLQHAKIFVSVIGEDAIKAKAVRILKSSAGFIASSASKKVRLRYFPELVFILDDTVDKQMKINDLISSIEEERNGRE